MIQELKQYPALRVEVGNAAIESLERMREMSKKAALQLVDMECSYLTVDFFRKLPQDAEKGGNPTLSIFDRYNDSYLRRIGKFYVDKSKLGIYLFLSLLVSFIWQLKNEVAIIGNPPLILGTLFFVYEQEQQFCLTSIWSVQLCETPFPNQLFIVKYGRLNEACLTISSPSWVQWR